LIQFDNMWNIQMSLGFGTSFWWVLVLEQWSNSKKSASIMSSTRWFLRMSRIILYMASGITSIKHQDSVTHFSCLIFLVFCICMCISVCIFSTLLYAVVIYVLYAIQFFFAGPFKFKNKKTRDLVLSNRGRLFTKMLWCLQIHVEGLKTLLLGVCVLSSSFLTC